MTPTPRHLAALVLLGLLAMHPATARAGEPAAGTGTVEIACATTALAAPLVMLVPLIALGRSDKHGPNVDVATIALFMLGGAAGVGFGGAGIGLQRGRPGACDGPCVGVYVASALGVGLGTLELGAGAFGVVWAAHGGRSAGVIAGPLVIPTEQGRAVGARFTVLGF
jgi:hypothetical protein